MSYLSGSTLIETDVNIKVHQHVTHCNNVGKVTFLTSNLVRCSYWDTPFTNTLYSNLFCIDLIKSGTPEVITLFHAT